MTNTPSIVSELSRQVNGVPISWLVAPDHVTIVFQDGRKLTFDKEGETDQEQELELETGADEIADKKPTRRKANAK